MKVTKKKISKAKLLREHLKKQRFMKLCISGMFLSVLIFTIATFVVFCFTGSEPSSLIECFFGFFGIEGGAMAIIRSSETIGDIFSKKPSDKKEETKEDVITDFEEEDSFNEDQEDSEDTYES